MSIQLGPEPEGLLCKRSDIMAWLPGLTVERWKKVRPHLEEVLLPGMKKPFYRREDVRRKLVNPMKKA